MKQFDVVVIGGGTAGSIAALSAARNGLKVLIIESNSYVGGLAAIGMTWGGFFDNNYKQVIGGIPDELVDKCKKLGGRGYFQYQGDGDKWITGLASVDPEIFRFVIERELYESGCEIMLFSLLDSVIIEANKIISIDVLSKLGRQTINAKYFIDATGELSLAEKCGVEWEHGKNGLTQCTSNMFRVLGVDLNKYEDFLEKYINTDKQDKWKKETGCIRRGIEYWCPWKLDGFDDMPLSLGVYYHGRDNDVILNCTAIDINPLDIFEISKASYFLRAQAFHVLDYLKAKVDGFQDAYISEIYNVAARESKRLSGDYVINIDDVVNHTIFKDSIGMGAYPPDFHAPSGSVHIPSTKEFNKNSDGAYDIPLRSMTSRMENLLVVGKCISATFDAQSALRGIGPCMVEGQGAGTAVALAIQEDISNIHQIDIEKLRSNLKRANVIFQA